MGSVYRTDSHNPRLYWFDRRRPASTQSSSTSYSEDFIPQPTKSKKFLGGYLPYILLGSFLVLAALGIGIPLLVKFAAPGNNDDPEPKPAIDAQSGAKASNCSIIEFDSSVRFEELTYNQDLKNKFSEAFITMSQQFCKEINQGVKDEFPINECAQKTDPCFIKSIEEGSTIINFGVNQTKDILPEDAMAMKEEILAKVKVALANVLEKAKNARSADMFTSGKISSKVDMVNAIPLKQCPSLVLPKYASEIIGSIDNNLIDAKVTLKCDPGYKFPNGEVDMTFHCLPSEEWDQTPVDCIPDPSEPLSVVTCENIDVPSDATILNGKETGNTPGDSLAYICNTGKTLTAGNAFDLALALTCQDDGEWDKAVKPCIDLVCPFVDPPQNSAITAGVASGNVYTDQVTVTCAENHQFSPDRQAVTLTCTAIGQWNDVIGVCEPTQDACRNLPTGCADFVVPPDVTMSVGSNTGNEVGDSVVLQCGAGFSFDPSDPSDVVMVLTCTKDGWDKDLDTCEPIPTTTICPPLTEPFNTELVSGELAGNTPGGVVVIKCDEGHSYSQSAPYDPTYNVIVYTCQESGQWDTPLTNCYALPTCPVLTTPANAVVVSGDPSNGQPDSVVVFQCPAGYSFDASNSSDNILVVTCQDDGNWDKTTSSPCIALACPVVTIPGGSHLKVGSNANDGTRVAPETIILECDEGLELSDGSTEETLTCQASATWDKTPSVCSSVTCPVVTIPGGSQLKAGSSANDGTRVATETIVLECEGDKTLADDSTEETLTCQASGTWDKTPGVCTSATTCVTLVIPANSEVTSGTLAGSDVGDTVVIQCSSGHEFADSGDPTSTATCADVNTWTWDSESTCVAVVMNCEEPTIPDDATVTDGDITNTAVGGTATVKCNNGFEFSDESTEKVITCNSDGWDIKLTKKGCTAFVSCDNPAVPNAERDIKDEVIKQGTYVALTCDAGYSIRLIGDKQTPVYDEEEHYNCLGNGNLNKFFECFLWPTTCAEAETLGIVKQGKADLYLGGPGVVETECGK